MLFKLESKKSGGNILLFLFCSKKLLSNNYKIIYFFVFGEIKGLIDFMPIKRGLIWYETFFNVFIIFKEIFY